KRHNQWQRWTRDVIPRLIDVYADYMSRSKGLREIPATPCNTTSCSCDKKLLEVDCISFDRVVHVSLQTCRCRTAPMQLLARGFFPCAPIAPSMAFDLRLLEFARLLFARLTPNSTGWCEAVEVFMYLLRYRLDTK
ncbi:hypothetical protein CONPUDRAFT_15837, partial [Coniophora puteana RWD-64-598 SS2]